MRAVYALVFALGGAAVADDKANPEPLKAVAGDGALTSFDGKGVKLNRADLKKLAPARRDVVITADTITAEFGGKKETRTFKVDNTKTPHHIDLTLTKDGKAETSYGIYKVEKGVLMICATEQDKAESRPTEFKTGRDVFLMTVRKRGELDGTYLLTGLETKTLKLTETDLKKVPEAERQLVIDDDEIVMTFNGKEDAATFRVDNSQTPHHITLTTSKDGKTETNYGIYKFEKGVLTICAGTKGDLSARPKEFKADDQSTVLVLQQQPRK
jgi:uncharacterized protein (TIGR03067 family)